MLITVAVSTAIVLSGCAPILEGYKLSESPHFVQPPERLREERIEISNYDQLKSEMLNYVMRHEESGRMYTNNYDGDVAEDVMRACSEIENDDPVGAYAVSSITGIATRIVSYHEVNVNITYKRTKQQVDSIVNVSTKRYLRTELLNVMRDYREEAVFNATKSITKDDILWLVEDIYYDNPRTIVMKPVVAVEEFQVSGDSRIMEIRFGHIVQASILQQHSVNLALAAQRNAEEAVGENDAEILLFLTERLMAACSYDEGMAKTTSVHGAQNFAATAYGAWENGIAVGEGFAMAFKALCDVLGFDCQVVLGYHDGMVHAWNTVSLYGEYYHIDVARCSIDGIENAFLKTDDDFRDRYKWDMENTVSCNGTMTYEDIVGTEELDEDDPGDGEIDPDERPEGDITPTSGTSDNESSNSSEHSNEDTADPSDTSEDILERQGTI